MSVFNVIAIALVLAALPVCGVIAQERGTAQVRLQDQAGRIIVAAEVTVTVSGGIVMGCMPANDGFTCGSAEAGDVVEVLAYGFARAEVELGAEAFTSAGAIITLYPPPITDRVVVTAGRVETRLGETPASVAVVPREAIATTGAVAADDILRQVPGFSTFRRSSSRHSNPTTQGVSIRGAGGSGAGRTLVLKDGVPLNDPFGGWMQWARVLPIEMESAEVVRGGGSSLYGSGSLSGTVNLLSRKASDRGFFSAEVYGGNQNTGSASAIGGVSRGGWQAMLGGGHFYTRGYIPVESASRGSADTPAGVRSTVVNGYLAREIFRSATIFIQPSYFSEERRNGTRLQTNATNSGRVAIGGTVDNHADDGNWRFDWRLFGGSQVYEQTFTAVAADRATESLTRTQRSPARDMGLSAQARAFAGRHTLVLGGDGRSIRGASDEVGYFGGAATSLLGTRGRERSVGVYVHDLIAAGERVVISASLRYDRWRNDGGYRQTTPLNAGNSETLLFAARSESALSPRLSMLVRGPLGLSFHGAASRSFRAPTLNELYRGFRVGNVVTNANEALQAERATTVEGGVSYRRGTAYVRANVFGTYIDRTVSNVTISVTPQLITRQRQNAGRSRAVGFEAEADWRMSAATISAGYIFADSRVTDFPSNPALVGNFQPQTARHQFTAQVRVPFRPWLFAVQKRAASAQFDDDLNLFRLEPYFQADAFVSRRIGRSMSLFAGVENLFNSRYSVGRTPIRTVSAPIAARVGFRWN
ncbi:MAG TPA: TonB-dependent receptor [Pyrinomonadaceae bacterium]|nr:TonB-dependent receptor [Pyrinomonadaceae bacterium]